MSRSDSPARKKRLAIVDDEPDILELVAIHTGRAGFDTSTYATAADFLASLESVVPDLLVLDLMLPDANGLDLCKRLRKEQRTARLPVIMLTALGEEADRIVGLEIGADDYVSKPFSPRELVARIKAVLRRSEEPPGEGGDAGLIRVGDALVVDASRFVATVGGEDAGLTSTEFRILAILAAHPGRVFTREQILEKLWGNEKAVLDRTVDVHIRHIREKLGSASSMVKNVRGVGYKIEH